MLYLELMSFPKIFIILQFNKYYNTEVYNEFIKKTQAYKSAQIQYNRSALQWNHWLSYLISFI